MKIKCAVAVLLTVMTFFAVSLPVFADGQNDVEIAAEYRKSETEGIYEFSVDVRFIDASLINDGVKFSYHISDSNNEIIAFENERFPIDVSGDPSHFDFSVDAEKYFTEFGVDSILIDFDIVDETNVFWYAQNPDIKMGAEKICLTKDCDVAVKASADNSSEGTVDIKADVTFNDTALLNSGLKLSYHLLDKNGAMLVFENERIPLDSQQAHQTVDLTINTNELYDISGGADSVVVSFDIVDENNVFWFSDNSDISFVSQPVSVTPTAGGAGNTDMGQKKTEVVILADIPSVIKSYAFDTNLSVSFSDPGLYNDSVKISYRVLDPEMNMISAENERVPLEYDGDKWKAHMSIDLLKAGVRKGENAVLVFDIVDEQNVYWFSGSDSVNLITPQISFEYDWLWLTSKTYTELVTKQPVQLVLNIVIAVLAILGYVRLRKKITE